MLNTCIYISCHGTFVPCLLWPAVLITSEANGTCCRGGYHNALNPSILPTIIAHFNPTQPQRQPSDGPLSAGFHMSGVPVQSTRRDTGMCTKAVTAFYRCQCWRLSSPQKSQLAHCGCLIFNTSE